MSQTKTGRRNYILGFGLSLTLTLLAYVLVTKDRFSKLGLIISVLGLAIAQLIVQLIFFLHLGKEGKPRWNLYVFLFMLMVVGIIVGGSLWIMYNLDYNHGGHRHTETPQRIIEDEGVKL